MEEETVDDEEVARRAFRCSVSSYALPRGWVCTSNLRIL